MNRVGVVHDWKMCATIAHALRTNDRNVVHVQQES